MMPKQIIRIVYYRPSTFETILIDGKEASIPKVVAGFFRYLKIVKKIESKVVVEVFDYLL